MRSLWKDANDEGASITDSVYQTILVSSLPITFYTIIGNVMSATNVTEAKVIIINWKATIDRMGGGASGNVPSIPTNLTTTALATKPKPNRSQMVCENCHRRGHGIGTAIGKVEERRDNSRHTLGRKEVVEEVGGTNQTTTCHLQMLQRYSR